MLLSITVVGKAEEHQFCQYKDKYSTSSGNMPREIKYSIYLEYRLSDI